MPNDPKPAGPVDRPPLRVGLIGVTGYALAYFEELNKLVEAGSVKWGAVTIINRADAPAQVAFFEAAGIPIYGDYLEMLEHERGKLDWVCVPTAIGWHTRMTVDALRCGIPVLLEKPIAPTLQEVEVIQAAERASGLVVAIGYQHQYSDSTWEIKRRLVEGQIGDLRQIDSICLWPRPRAYYSRNHWAGRLYVGESWVLDSPLHNAISHVVNLILFFAGSTLEDRADPIQVEAELYRSKPIQNFDTIRSQVDLDTGVRAGVVLSHSSRETVDPEIRIRGTRGTLVWSFSGAHTLEVDGQVETLDLENQVRVRESMFGNVVRLIHGDPSARTCTTEQAKGEVKWVNAVQDASAIHDIPENAHRQRVDESGEVFDFVEDLDSIVMRAYQKGCWFRDLNVPWAVAPGKFDLKGYSSFQARKFPSPVPPVEASIF